MKIYIAAKYGRRLDEDVKVLRRALEKAGHEITARWLDNAEESKSPRDAAHMDVDDVLRADALIFIAEPRGSSNRGGGRWFEFGVAWSESLRIFVLEPEPLDPNDPRRDESIFTHLDGVVKCETHGDLFDAIYEAEARE